MNFDLNASVTKQIQTRSVSICMYVIANYRSPPYNIKEATLIIVAYTKFQMRNNEPPSFILGRKLCKKGQ